MDEIIPISGKVKLCLSGLLKIETKPVAVVEVICYRDLNWFDKSIDWIMNWEREFIEVGKTSKIVNHTEDWKMIEQDITTPNSTKHIQVRTKLENVPFGYARNIKLEKKDS